jgi:hypothetical protein
MHSNRFPILYSDRGFFVVSLDVENEEENMENKESDIALVRASF